MGQPHSVDARQEAPLAIGILILVENLPVPFDRRVWQEARSLKGAGYAVSVICPKGHGYDAAYEEIEGIHVYRHKLPVDAEGAFGFLLEYSSALLSQFVLSVKVYRRHGFDAIQACNPPDLLFLIAIFYKLLFGTKFVFDHHDISPELYEAKFGRRGLLHKALLFFERCTFRLADVSIATNDSFKDIAVARGKMRPENVWVVKSFPDLARFHRVPADPSIKRGRDHLIGYVGVMGRQDGVEYLVRAIHHIVVTRGRTDIGCVIIGNGPEVERLKSIAAELDVSRFIEFTGFLSGSPLLTCLSTIDVGVIPDPPNSYNDKISMNKVFEYMSLGIPFVQFDVAEGRSAAGEAAFVAETANGVALGDALIHLIDSPEQRREMSDYGRTKAAQDFQWSTAESALLDAYRTLFSTDVMKSGSRRKKSLKPVKGEGF